MFCFYSLQAEFLAPRSNGRQASQDVDLNLGWRMNGTYMRTKNMTIFNNYETRDTCNRTRDCNAGAFWNTGTHHSTILVEYTSLTFGNHVIGICIVLMKYNIGWQIESVFDYEDSPILDDSSFHIGLNGIRLSGNAFNLMCDPFVQFKNCIVIKKILLTQFIYKSPHKINVGK